MRWSFWIDRGGTFTDLVAHTPDGRLIQKKLLSENPEHYDDAALAGIRDCLGLARHDPIPPGSIDQVRMGTTVGTNALLTRTGEPTVFVVTAGFADQLRIGDQSRPDIFALHIQRPAPLYAALIEATERLDAQGDCLVELQLDPLRQDLQAARQAGFRACAIAFLHAWKNPVHELAAGALARELGFEQVCLSHQASPLVKFVPRAETAVLDAYLSPPLRRYVDQVARQLPADAHLEFMQSNGGLTPADRFQGKDSVLSGPAGGLLGMIKVGQAAGFERLIGFDMGGTSTDVSLHAGALERTQDARVADCRIRVPMLAVHTVAAGGGSILHFDGQRLRVGPDSAGSLPGPAAYRRGGPLTVTDANLLLGRLQADGFPAVFGPQADQPLDLETVRGRFAALTAEVNAALGLDYSPERLAEGFLAIAAENMADAVRQITLARGVNPADYTLVSFGGAGGQHACAVAARLDMPRVLVSPFASVLSAYGIGLAERRELRLEAVEAELTPALLAELQHRLVDMAPDAQAAGLQTMARLQLHYAGADSVLTVPLAEFEAVNAAFQAEHRQRFGFANPARTLICAAIERETVSGGSEAFALPAAAAHPGAPRGLVKVHLAGRTQAVPSFERSDLASGQVVPGPALILEPGSCLVLEPGWQATLSPRGDLVCEHLAHQPSRPNLDRVDPTWLTLFSRRFMSIAEDMGRVLQQTARSVNIRERLDFSCALFDRAGQLIANAPHIPVHLGSMGESVQAIRDRFHDTLRPGRAYLLNSPYAGGTHLPDITVVQPIFSSDGAVLRYFTAARAHHADIGGIAPGSMPAASRHIDAEGCLSDGLCIVSEGVFLADAVRAWLNTATPPARNPAQNLADLQAQLAACQTGARLLGELEQEVGAPAVLQYMDWVQDNAEAAVQGLLSRLHSGRFSLPLDIGGNIEVSVTVDPAQGRATLDFSGTRGQHAGNLNAPRAIVRSAVLYVLRTLLDTDIPLNAGVLRPIDIRIPDGCLLNPAYPAAVVAGNVETSQHIVDALYGALGELAASQGTMNNLSFGDATHQYYETLCGGSGAGPSFEGADAVQVHMTNSRLTDPEVLELRYPVRVEGFGIRPGSGGQGQYRGGNGVVRRLRFLAPMHGNLLALRRKTAAFGLAGGGDGQPGRQWIERADGSLQALPGIAEFNLSPGDLLVIETPGGGGFGSPVE